MSGMLLDLDAYRQRVSVPRPSVAPPPPVLSHPVVEHRLCRREAQAAAGRAPLRDVLLSLRRSGLIIGFRLDKRTLVVKARRTLTFMFETHDFQ